jgi:hypothetical protein
MIFQIGNVSVSGVEVLKNRANLNEEPIWEKFIQ